MTIRRPDELETLRNGQWKMSEIAALFPRMILDSRGNPTVEVDCILESGSAGRAAVPSGASTGEAEAVELRDGGTAWGGKGVETALENVRGEIAEALLGVDALEQERVDRMLVELDGTPNKARLGTNAILAVSLAVCRAAADECELPLYRYIGGPSARRLPVPMMNVINGGAHASNNLEFQEFMLVPTGADDFPSGLRMGVETYHHLRGILSTRGLSVAIGDEGGFAPDLPNDEAALDLLVEAIEDAGYEAGAQVSIAIDVAASEFYRDGSYELVSRGGALDGKALIDHYAKLCERYPIISIEDGLDENDWSAWSQLTARLGERIALIGDDIFVTHPERLRRGIRERTANAILVKLNQIGTLSETLETIRIAERAGFWVVISHRSGETEDPFIADLAVATGCGWLKTGAPCRSDRNTKYNRLLRIHEELEETAAYGAR